MSSVIQRIGSEINSRYFGLTPQDTGLQKYSKIGLGVGFAGLAAIVWKVTLTAGLFYSIYKGGELVYSRFSQRRNGERSGERLEAEAPMAAPVHAGHEGHGDRDERREEPREALGVIGDLKRKQAEMMRDPRARDPEKIQLVFDAMIYHPKVLKNGRDLQWVSQKIRKYAERPKDKLAKMIRRRKFFWKIKEFFYCFYPTQEANA